MPYKHIDSRHKGEEYYNFFVAAGFNDKDANILARVKVQNDIDEIDADYRIRHNVFERTIDKIKWTIRKLKL